MRHCPGAYPAGFSAAQGAPRNVSPAQPHIDRLKPLHSVAQAFLAMQHGVPVGSAPVGGRRGALALAPVVLPGEGVLVVRSSRKWRLSCHQAVKHPPESLVQSSRCVKDRAMRPVGASLSHPCGWPLGVGFSAVPRWLPRFPALLSVPAMPLCSSTCLWLMPLPQL